MDAAIFLANIQKQTTIIPIHPHFALQVSKQEIKLFWTVGYWVQVCWINYRKNEWPDDNETLNHLIQKMAEVESAFLFVSLMGWKEVSIPG